MSLYPKYKPLSMNTVKMINEIQFAIDQVLNLFYPNLCIVCEGRTHSNEELFCMDCQYQIHPSEMYLLKSNEFTARFRGRVDLVNGAALYYYIKGGRLQKAMELLKYKNRPEIGLRLGKFFGRLLISNTDYSGIKYILPIPLHPNRKIQRGYNQSSLISYGLSESLNIPVREDILLRNKETYTQTEKNRIDRSINMQKVFELIHPEIITGTHLLLVDDIMTTGATLEAAAMILQKAGNVRISMITIALAT
jgi:ComF family protein